MTDRTDVQTNVIDALAAKAGQVDSISPINLASDQFQYLADRVTMADEVGSFLIERLIEGVSLAASQQPAGLGVANAKNVEFGAAVVGTDVSLSVGGQLTFHTGGLYRVKVVFQFGRTGQSGTSEILFRFLVAGVQIGRSVGAKLGNSDDLQYIDIDNWFNVPAGTTLDTQIMRDLSGNDSGGCFQTLPTIEGGNEWSPVPSAIIRVERWAPP